MSNSTLTCPNLVLMSGHNNNFTDYNNAVYSIFKSDFVDSKPIFMGTKLGLKKYPIVDGKEYTYYHFTHEGDVENNRLPDIRRMERIAFPKVFIEAVMHSDLLMWRKEIKGKNRILIFHENESYLIVLEDRGEYILPWTAYIIKENSRKRRLLAEYTAYQKTFQKANPKIAEKENVAEKVNNTVADKENVDQKVNID